MEDNMSNQFTVENTFIAGSKFLYNKIQKLKSKMGIPVTPKQIGIYMSVFGMFVVYLLTTPIFALPNYLIHLWKKSLAVITGKNKAGLIKL
tara:strand:- start:721 stop:993 length:273 start_codon:yes stop_codon:yes gene_type:complete